MEGTTINLKQYITNGFVRTGVIQMGYSIILLVLTGGVGYGVFNLHQANQLKLASSISSIVEYVLLAILGVLLISGLTLFMKGIKSFQHFTRFMKGTEVRLEGELVNDEPPMQIGVALDYLEDERIMYENQHVVLTSRHIIVLDGDPCIYPTNRIRKVSLDVESVSKGKQPNLVQLKTVVITLSTGENKKVFCHYLQEAQDVLNRLSKLGIKIDSSTYQYLKV